MGGVLCGACVQILALIAVLSSRASQPLARVVEPAPARGCVSERLSADVPEPAEVPEHRPPPPPQAMGMLGKVQGSELKFTFYRGIGGGLRIVTTDGGAAFSFEAGVGLGGSFSAGTADDLPNPGPAAEGRVSLNTRLLPVRPPDFGATVDATGKLQGYTDVKTGKYRTRFHSRPVHLMGDEEAEAGTEAPIVRRSWSLGSEFKIAIKYTLRSAWDDVLDLLSALAHIFPSAQVPPVPLARPVDAYVFTAHADRGHTVRPADAPFDRAECRTAAPPGAERLSLLMAKCERRTRNARTRRTGRRSSSA